jgi:hypothetical protein
VYSLAYAYDGNKGHLPSTLDLQACNEVYAGSMSADGISLKRNVITGAYTRLDAKEFSPGDMYIKRLTSEEFSRLVGSSDTRPRAATGPAYYVRVYGDSGVILSEIEVEANESMLSEDDLPDNPNRPSL